MKKLLILFLLISSTCQAGFVAIEDGQILYAEGDIHTRHSPCSTFKVALSLMGFDSEILKDAHCPVWDYDEAYASLLPDILERWLQPHDPQLWLENSCVWYSQVLTQMLGIDEFDRYIHVLNYGNGDHQNDLTHAWLMRSLKISPMEQVEFLDKMLNLALPVSAYAQQVTAEILFREELDGGWSLYGKTGSGTIGHLANGWFVGWVEKGERRIIFAQHILEDKQEGIYGSMVALTRAKQQFDKLL